MVMLGFAALMVVSGVQMLRAPGTVGGACSLPTGGINWRSCLPKAIGAGLFVGFLTGLFGVGGGFLIIPALVVLLGLPMTSAVATSLVIIAVNTVAGFSAHAGEAVIDVRITAAFTIAAVVGALVAGRAGEPTLRRAAPALVRLPRPRRRRLHRRPRRRTGQDREPGRATEHPAAGDREPTRHRSQLIVPTDRH